MMEPGSGRPGGDTESVGDPVERPVQVVVQHDHRAMLDRKPPEPTLELIAIDDRA